MVIGRPPRSTPVLLTVFVVALATGSACTRDRDCYPICPAGYAPAVGCSCAPIATNETADAGAADAKR